MTEARIANQGDLLELDRESGPAVRDDDEDRRATELERRRQEESKAQFRRLKDEARAIYGMVDGRPGVRSPAEWQKLLERAGDEIGNGRFLVRCLGAERYLDALTVSVLVTLRQSLIAELPAVRTADVMRVDAAVLAYFNMLRVQGWIGNMALIVERELFGQEPRDDEAGQVLTNQLEQRLRRLGEVMLPLLDRTNRMMLRNLDRL